MLELERLEREREGEIRIKNIAIAIRLLYNLSVSIILIAYMTFYSWENLLDASSTVNDMGRQIAEKSREFGCRLWSDYPGSWAGQLPTNQAVRQFWNTLCDSLQPPVLPEPPNFTGGQCDFKYNLQVIVGVYPSTVNCDRVGDPTQTVNIVVWGPISFVGLEEPDGICGGFNRLFCICHGNGVLGREPNPIYFLLASGILGRFEQIKSITITPESGDPDICGDPPPSYAPDTPPSPGDETFNVTFNTDTTNNFDFDLTWNDVKFSIPLTFNFEAGDVILNFDGVDINLTQNNSWNIRPPSRDFGPIRLPAPPPNNEDYEEIEELPSDGEKGDVGIDIAYITLELTVIPANANTQWGRLAPDVFYAGWFEFQTGEFSYPRQPIHFEKNIYIPPIGATGYAYTLYEGFSGRIKTYQFKTTN